MYAGSESAICIATATRSRALAAFAACRQTLGASADEGAAVVDVVRETLSERWACAPEPLSAEEAPQPASNMQLMTSAAHPPSRVR
jgi:hypothetical protein